MLETEPVQAAVKDGVDRPAALVTPAGSACPDLPLPEGRVGDEIVVAVAFPVDARGRVDTAGVQVVESPRTPSSGRGYYPRIYVVGGKGGRGARRVDRARYDSAVTHLVTRHVAALRFQPALAEGRPVRSTVLVACHQEQGG